MTRQWVLATLVASAALAFAGASEASTAACSPPAPRRAAASPRRSAAGASATATHMARSRHVRKHHRGHRAGNHHSQDIIASSAGTTAGGSPSLPARRNPANNHHADLRPVPHSARPSARVRAGWHGNAAECSASAADNAAMKRLRFCASPAPVSNEDRLTLGRGPPRASPDRETRSSSRLLDIPVSAFVFLHPTTWSQRSIAVRICPGSGFSAVPTPAALEGAVACFDSPSIGDLS